MPDAGRIPDLGATKGGGDRGYHPSSTNYKLWYLFLHVGNFHSNTVILLGLWLIFAKNKFHQFLLSGFNVDYPVTQDFSKLVVIYV